MDSGQCDVKGVEVLRYVVNGQCQIAEVLQKVALVLYDIVER
jgi:hypothetical protein